MSTGSPLPPDRVPTLTEVVAWPETAAAPLAEALPAERAAEPAPHVSHGIALSESELNERVLAAVQRQIDLMLDYRLREVLTPVITRLADNLVRETRAELASTLRDVVARAVAQELSRHRGR